ncbi:uncharacterized protein DFL_001292 [Arthrobotrys flagrans]|uniref:Uncharacterized protein n=1 Tax=Arthrobotrys flagrans TaxID=97331 RepID=A0A437AGW6_ARTFL|nr:hypothetical protein DFL_001292 [Arthrobotrys flagrans]
MSGDVELFFQFINGQVVLAPAPSDGSGPPLLAISNTGYLKVSKGSEEIAYLRPNSTLLDESRLKTRQDTPLCNVVVGLKENLQGPQPQVPDVQQPRHRLHPLLPPPAILHFQIQTQTPVQNTTTSTDTTTTTTTDLRPGPRSRRRLQPRLPRPRRLLHLPPRLRTPVHNHHHNNYNNQHLLNHINQHFNLNLRNNDNPLRPHRPPPRRKRHPPELTTYNLPVLSSACSRVIPQSLLGSTSTSIIREMGISITSTTTTSETTWTKTIAAAASGTSTPVASAANTLIEGWNWTGYLVLQEGGSWVNYEVNVNTQYGVSLVGNTPRSQLSICNNSGERLYYFATAGTPPSTCTSMVTASPAPWLLVSNANASG